MVFGSVCLDVKTEEEGLGLPEKTDMTTDRLIFFPPSVYSSLKFRHVT